MKAARHEIFDIDLAHLFKVRSTVYCTVYTVHFILPIYSTIVALSTFLTPFKKYVYIFCTLICLGPERNQMWTPRSLMLQLV